jgi:hypothetical protein
MGGEDAHNLHDKQRKQPERIEGSLSGNALRGGRKISPSPSG